MLEARIPEDIPSSWVAEPSSAAAALVAAWFELCREIPICSKATIVRNLPVDGTHVKPAFLTSVSCVVGVVGGGDVGELVLVSVLHPSCITKICTCNNCIRVS